MPITQFNCSKQSCKTVLMTSDEQYVDSMREVAGMRVWVRTDVTLCMNSVRNYNTDVTLCIRDPESWIGDWLLSQSRSGTVDSAQTNPTQCLNSHRSRQPLRLGERVRYRRANRSHWAGVPAWACQWPWIHARVHALG